MRPTPLPRGIRQHLPDGVLDAQVRVAGDQVDLVQATGLEVAEEPGPRGHRLGCGDLHAQQLPVAFRVDTGGQQDGGFHDPAVRNG